MTAIIDYGVGNLFSLKSSFASIGEDAIVTADPEALKAADRLILPGGGAFGDAAEKLAASGLDRVLVEEAKKGKPVMGICLGMQLLLERGFEYGEHAGLGLIKGEIRAISEVIPKSYPIPQIGWNSLVFRGENHPIFKYINDGDYVYFVHSFYAAKCSESVIADTEYGAYLTAAVADGNVCGCQFHPEKSGNVGLKILKAFCEMK